MKNNTQLRILLLIVNLCCILSCYPQGKITRPVQTQNPTIRVVVPQKMYSIDYDAPFSKNVLDGLEYQSQGLEGKAIMCFEFAAENGNLDAMRCLGNLYLRGQKYKDAFSWYMKAAEKGDSKAEFEIGNMYFEGLDIPQKLSEAFKWYEKAAKHNFAEAQCKLGDFYYDGIYVDSNRKEALKWYKLAAQNGNIEAAQYLGDKYQGNLRKIYVIDNSKAKKW